MLHLIIMNKVNSRLPLIIFSLLIGFLLASCNNHSVKTKSGIETVVTNSEVTNSGKLYSEYSPVSQELYNEIFQMDRILFSAFNAHDIEQMQIIFSPELEFYHDKVGLTDYEKTIENFKSLFEKNKDTGLRRDLVKNSLEVYPVKDYGAIEVGIHKFCHTEYGKEDCGTFKFVQIWNKKNGQWKLIRVISYDH